MSAAEWNEHVLSLPHPHFLQSFEWGEIKSAHGWTPHRLRWAEGAVSVLVRSRGPLRVAYAPRGPLCDWDDPDRLEDALARLEAFARGQGVLFLKADPELPHGHPGERLLAERGWRRSPEQIQFRNTLLLDLRPDEEALLAGMKSKTRYNVRLAGRRGVRVERRGAEGLTELYEMYRRTAARQSFPIRPWPYYRTVWETLIRAGLAEQMVALRQGRPLAALFVVAFGPRSTYLHGASREEGREHMPTYLLQWEAIRWSRQRGCRTYDLWGAPDRLEESDPMWGVFRFKEGFGGELFRGSGAWDYPVSAAGTWAYQRLVPRLLGLMRRRQLRAGPPA